MSPNTATITADSTESLQSGSETQPAQEKEPVHTDTAEPVVTGLQNTAGKTATGEPAEEVATAPATEIPPAVIAPAEKAPAQDISAAVAPPADESTGLAETIESPVGQEPSTGEEPLSSTEEETADAAQSQPPPAAASAIADTGVSSPADSDQAAVVETAPVSSAGESPQPSENETTGAVPEGSSTTGAAEGKRPYELLAAAREAYWLHDYDLAEENYREWMKLEPDNPDSYGELGNLYFSQGKWEEAAGAYYEAGVRLVKSGNLQQASELLEVIRGLNGPQSDELERLIKQAKQ
jgi:hypothetical protein